MVKSFFLLCALILCNIFSFAQEVNIIPQPAELVKNEGSFTISPKTKLVVANKADNATAAFLNKYLL